MNHKQALLMTSNSSTHISITNSLTLKTVRISVEKIIIHHYHFVLEISDYDLLKSDKPVLQLATIYTYIHLKFQINFVV